MMTQMFVYARSRPIFTLSGEFITRTDPVSPFNTKAAVRVGSDGNMFSATVINGSPLIFGQIDNATDWIRPTTEPTAFFVRYSNVTGTFTTTPGAVDTAIALTTNRDWTIANAVDASEKTTTFDLEILGKDATTVLAGPTLYTLQAINNL